jgi:hypothetical protein
MQGCGSGSAWISIILDPDPHLSQNPRALEAQNRVMEGRERVEARNGALN